MVDRYLADSDLFVLHDEGVKSICAVMYIGNASFELKNLATYPEFQKRGYAKALVKHVLAYYKKKGRTLFVGTGDVPGIIGFYQRCGFMVSYRVNNFFIDNYDHPIFEDGIQLIDMVYLKQDL